MSDDEYAAFVRLYDVLEMLLYRGLAPEGQRAVGAPSNHEIVNAIATARPFLAADPRWHTLRQIVTVEGFLVAVPARPIQRPPID